MMEINYISNLKEFDTFTKTTSNGKISMLDADESRDAKAEKKTDRITISPEASAKIAETKEDKKQSKNSGELSEEEKKVVTALKKRDAEVKQHEQAHLSAGGGLVRGGASFSYEVGPDGARYAIGGEVQIDVSAESDPKATITKMQQVQRAALAPSDPSGQDRAVASMASKILAEAVRQSIAEASQETSQEANKEKGKDSINANTQQISPQSQIAMKAYRHGNYSTQ